MRLLLLVSTFWSGDLVAVATYVSMLRLTSSLILYPLRPYSIGFHPQAGFESYYRVACVGSTEDPVYPMQYLARPSPDVGHNTCLISQLQHATFQSDMLMEISSGLYIRTL